LKRFNHYYTKKNGVKWNVYTLDEAKSYVLSRPYLRYESFEQETFKKD
jgi:hypothetical protein